MTPTDLDAVLDALGKQPQEDRSVDPETARRLVESARAAARRRHRRRHSQYLAAAAVILVVVLAGVGVAVLRPGPPPASQPGVDWWGARGDQTANQTLIGAAEQAWRTEAPQPLAPSRTVSVLYAGTTPANGPDPLRLVVLRSDTGNATYVAFVSSVVDNNSYTPTTDLALRSVAVVPRNETIRSVMAVAPLLPKEHPSTMTGSWCFALLAPGPSDATCGTSMLDGTMSDTTDQPATSDGFMFDRSFPGTSAWNSWLATDSHTRLTGRDIIAAGITDPAYSTGLVTSISSKELAVRSQDPQLAPRRGDLILDRNHQPAGSALLGVVTSEPGPDGTVTVDTDLTHLADYDVAVTSVDSNYSGTLVRDQSGGLRFQTEATSLPNGVSRIVAVAANGSVMVNVAAYSGPGNAEHPPLAVVPLATKPTVGDQVTIIATASHR